ncbi:MAG: MFS transporter [Rhodoglobus sp.]
MPAPHKPVSASVGRPRLPRDVYVLGVIAFLIMVGFGVVVPVLPVFARSFGVGNFEVGAVISAFALMRLITSPICGRLIDLLGERIVLSGGIFIVAVSSGLVGIAQNYLQLLILRGVGGIGSALFTVAAMTLVLRVTLAPTRARAIGFYQGGFLLGGMAGPALGAALATISLTAPFFFYAAILAAAGTVGLALLRRGTGSVSVVMNDTATTRMPLREILTDRRFRAACLANFAQGWTSFGVRAALVPVLVVDVLHAPAESTGIVFAIAAAAQTVVLSPAARFVDTVGRKPAIIGSFLVAAAAIGAVPFAPTVTILTIALCLYGLASAFMGTAPAAAVGDVATAGDGRPVAVFSMLSDVGAIVGPLVAGMLADTVSYPAAFGVGALLLALAALYATRMPRKPRD